MPAPVAGIHVFALGQGVDGRDIILLRHERR